MATGTKYRILVVTPRYVLSGVALAQTRFARSLALQGHDVTLMIGHVDPKLELPEQEGVKNIVIGSERTLGMAQGVYRYLRDQKPDIVFSAEDHLNVLVLMMAILARSNAKISASSRVTPFDTYSNRPLTKRWVLKKLARATAWRADALTCVSEEMVGQYRAVFPRGKHQRVYNIVDSEFSGIALPSGATMIGFPSRRPRRLSALEVLPNGNAFRTPSPQLRN